MTMFRTRHQIIIIGVVTGVASATFTVALASWFGIERGASFGIAAAAIIGAAGTFSAARVLEQSIQIHLSSSNAGGWRLPGYVEEELGGDVGAIVSVIRDALRKAKEIEAENEKIGRIARAFWEAVHASPNGAAAPADLSVCVAGSFGLFRQTAEILVRYAGSLEDANERMASGAVDQTETVARTTSTVEELSENIDKISQNADNATDACERTRHEARLGLEQVHRVIEGMDRLRAQIEVNGRKAKRLGDRSVEIGTIVELIRGISSRTDMLALNATIESVRAGEHGRGFAVVAEEIRKLAERTASATRDIGTLVEAIQADTHESIRALGEEQNEMEQESQRVRDTGSALERISQVAEQSALLVDGISRSTND